MSMTKYNAGDTISCVARMTGQNLVVIKGVIDALGSFPEESLRLGDEVKVGNIGIFKTLKRAARVGRNPKTGAPVEIPARKVIKFVPAKALKDMVAGK